MNSMATDQRTKSTETTYLFYGSFGTSRWAEKAFCPGGLIAILTVI